VAEGGGGEWPAAQTLSIGGGRRGGAWACRSFNSYRYNGKGKLSRGAPCAGLSPCLLLEGGGSHPRKGKARPHLQGKIAGRRLWVSTLPSPFSVKGEGKKKGEEGGRIQVAIISRHRRGSWRERKGRVAKEEGEKRKGGNRPWSCIGLYPSSVLC